MEYQEPEELKNQNDVSPSEQLEKIVVEQPEMPNPPNTNGTGSNREVFNGGSIIIKKDEDEDNAPDLNSKG